MFITVVVCYNCADLCTIMTIWNQKLQLYFFAITANFIVNIFWLFWPASWKSYGNSTSFIFVDHSDVRHTLIVLTCFYSLTACLVSSQNPLWLRHRWRPISQHRSQFHQPYGLVHDRIIVVLFHQHLCWIFPT